ncbi:MAG: hypothetical protein ACREVD_10600 [Burkholderiales bacterium]
MSSTLALLALALAAGADQTDDPMIRWDCDKAGSQLLLEMVRPPVNDVKERELLLLSGSPSFEQCHINGASWTLLVDLIEYDSGRCEPEPDTIVSLLRNDKLVVSSVHIGRNCADRPVMSALRITEPADGQDPGLELCTAETYGAEGRCSPLQLRDMKEAIDDKAIAARARRP